VSAQSPFREQAVQYAAQGHTEGDVLHLSPAWIRWAYPALVAAFAAAVLYALFGTVHEYATGSAVVWMTGQSEITATVPGTVQSVEVHPEQRVAAGALLVRCHAEREAAEFERLQREFDLQLLKTLHDPSDHVAERALTSLRTQRDVALAHLEELSVRAPRAGVIGDVRIWPGQRLEPGAVILTLVGSDTQISIRAMIPAQYKPQLHPGMSLRVELTGYRYAYQETLIDSVGAQVIGPNELQRYLGHELADTVKVDGPLVLVETRPLPPSFAVDRSTFNFHHGMSGVAEIRLRTESILVALVPSLRVISDAFKR
jgi:membrane fusion protein (multidrug efflux system)